MNKIWIFALILFQCSINDFVEEDIQYINIILSNNERNEELFIEKDGIFPFANYLPNSSFYYGSNINSADSLGSTSLLLFNSPGSIPISLSISFPGKKEGIFPWSSNYLEGSLFINKTTYDPEYIYLEGLIIVNKYGKIGKRIEGSISGGVVELLTGDTLQVNGKFSLVRGEDFPEN